MTEPLDLDTLEQVIHREQSRGWIRASVPLLFNLIAELRATRAERDCDHECPATQDARRERARAAAAEAQLRQMVKDEDVELETLRSRIAAALDWFARTDCTWAYRTEMARRALTEGTP